MMRRNRNIIIWIAAVLVCCCLVTGCADTGQLDALIHMPIENEEYYTPNSYDTYTNALAAVQELQEQILVFQSDVDAAAAALRESIDGLQPRADKSGVTQAILRAEEIDTSLYLPVSCTALQVAIAHAETVAADPNALEADVDAAVALIEQCLNELEIKPDKSGLIALCEEAAVMNTSEFLPCSVSVFTAAMNDAKAVIQDENATYEDVQSAGRALQSAIDNLELKPEKTVLIALYNEVKAIDTADYLTVSTASLPSALNNAEAVIGNDDANEQDVQSAIDTLQNAVDKLELKPDKTKLNNLIDKAEDYAEEKYTTVSYKALQDVIKSIRVVQSNSQATQADVDNATEELQGAINDLVKCTKCVWKVSVSLRRTATNHVGNDWNSGIYYNGESVYGSFEVTVKEGSSITITGKAVEQDSVPDSGSGKLYLTMKDGNEGSITFYVYENRGRYSGNRAVWELSASCELIERV